MRYGSKHRVQADLVLHIHRELIHHLSEVCLLRDLYLHTKPGTRRRDQCGAVTAQPSRSFPPQGMLAQARSWRSTQ
jgi:hypothetical protein